MSEQPMKPNVSGFETCTYREVRVNGMRCLRPGDDPDWRLKPRWFSMMVTDACESGFRPGALELEVHRVLTEKCLAHSFGWPVVFPPDLDGDMIRDCAEEAGTEHVVVMPQ